MNALRQKLILMRAKYMPKLKRYKISLQNELYEQGIGDGAKIHRVIVVPTLRKIHFFIRLSRPGIFIGRQGKDLYAMQASLESYYRKPVVFHLKQYDPFWD